MAIAGINLPELGIGGLISSSWVYIFIIGLIGFVLICVLGFFLFSMTYNRRVILFENIAGQGYQPVLRTKARLLKISRDGTEILKTLAGGHFVSAYGRKMGKNTYWYAKGQDGYWYNIILGDLDSKLGMLDIEPIDRDVRMFYVAINRMAQDNWGKANFFEKYAVHLMLFVFLIAFMLGMFFMVSKFNDGMKSLSATASTNEKVATHLDSILIRTGNLQSQLPPTTSSGLVTASTVNTTG